MPKPERAHEPKAGGPKERELATQLTVAVIAAATFPKNDPSAVADAASEIYRKMLALVGPPGPH